MAFLLRRPAMRAFIVAILAVGVLRFVLTMQGLPNSSVKFASMSAVIFLGAVYFALTTSSHKERFKAAFLLVFPYMVIEVGALAYTWITGHPTIFHAREYSFGVSSAGLHMLGHFIGGLTWEPVMVFVIMQIVWFIAKRTPRMKDE